jgi:hypothetical protein
VTDDAPPSAAFEVQPGNAWLHVIVRANRGTLVYDFLGPAGTGRLKPGWYGDLHDGPHLNPALGKTDVNAGCGGTSWFAIDRITYADDAHVTDLALRFEVRCGDAVLLRGAFAFRAP